MKIVNPSFEILPQGEGIDGVYELIEKAGRTCYKSENKIAPGTAKEFVDRMINSEHYAMLEHGTVYLRFENYARAEKYEYDKYSVVEFFVSDFFVTTNLRVLVENEWLDDLDYICKPTKIHEKRVTVLFHTQIAISREFNRHRVNSMAESSTRYCNYSKKKFGNEITINKPSWVSDKEIEPTREMLNEYCRMIANNDIACMEAIDWWYFANMASELAYMKLIECGKKPQEARVVLPLDTNTDLVHTAFVSDWKHFFDLRALDKTGAAHPDAKALALPLREEFFKRGYIR